MTTTDIILLIVSALLHIVGLVGSLIPVLPGAPLCFAGMVLCAIVFPHPVMITLTVVMGLLVLIGMIVDYVAPSILTDKAGGSKYAIWGANIGLVVGLIFFAPFGVIICPFLGAFIGEVISSHKFGHSMKIAAYTFLSFVIGTLFKFILCVVMLCICIGCVVVNLVPLSSITSYLPWQ